MLERVWTPSAIGQLTITIHSAMSTRLFPIALDLFASAFIAGSGHPSSLLHMFRVIRGRALGVVLIIVEVVIVFMDKAGVVFAVKRTRRSSHIA